MCFQPRYQKNTTFVWWMCIFDLIAVFFFIALIGRYIFHSTSWLLWHFLFLLFQQKKKILNHHSFLLPATVRALCLRLKTKLFWIFLYVFLSFTYFTFILNNEISLVSNFFFCKNIFLLFIKINAKPALIMFKKFIY